MKELTAESVGKRVLVRARLHTTRGTGRDLVHVCVIESIHFKLLYIFMVLNDLAFSCLFKGSSAL